MMTLTNTHLASHLASRLASQALLFTLSLLLVSPISSPHATSSPLSLLASEASAAPRRSPRSARESRREAALSRRAVSPSRASARSRRSTTTRTTVTRRRTYQPRRPARRPARRVYVDHHDHSYSPRRPSAWSGLRLFEVGTLAFAPTQGDSYNALSLGAGYRISQLGMLAEVQLSQDSLGVSVLNDVNLQLRAYVPLKGQLELFPLVAFGHSHSLTPEAGKHLDVGFGAQFKLLESFAIGARYQARVIADGVGYGNANGHQLSAQLSFRF